MATKGRESPFGADAVLQDRGAVFRHGNVELRREGRRFRVLVAGRDHFPIAADGFVHLDDDGGVLVAAQGDLILEFPGVGIDVFVVGLLVLGDDVESIADVDADLFVFGSVIDAVFSREKDAALGVFLINPYIAGGEGDAQAVFFFVFEFVVDHHGIFYRRSGGLLIAIVGA